MNMIFETLKDLFLHKGDEKMKVGLSQFKNVTIKTSKKGASVKNREMKLSDLMRRAS